MSEDVWIAVGAFLLVLVLFGVSLLVPRRSLPSPATLGRFDQLVKRLDDVEAIAAKAQHDASNVRMSVGALATKESVGRVEVQVAEMRGEMKGVMTHTEMTSHSVTRIESFLMQAAASAMAGAREPEKKAARNRETEVEE